MNTRSCLSLFKRLPNISCKNAPTIQFYSRWAHRRPARVLTPEEYNAQENVPTKRIEPEHFNDIIELNSTEVISETVKKNKRQHSKATVQEDILYDIDSLDAETHFTEKKKNKKQKDSTKNVKYTTQDVQITTFDEDGNFIYTKMKENDSKIG